MPQQQAGLDECLRVLQRYAPEYRPAAGELREMPGGFSGARIWKIETLRGNFCLRRMPAQLLEPARLNGLHRLLRHIHGAGVEQVAVPVATISGTTWTIDGSSCWQLEPWMPGEADFHLRPTRGRLAATMECLARWHRAAAAFVANGAESQWFFNAVAPSPGIHERLTLARRWDRSSRDVLSTQLSRLDWPEFSELGQHILAAFERLVAPLEEQLLVSSRMSVPLQPCLRDIWHDHVLFVDERVGGLIDPFACRSENVTADLARLLGSLLHDDRSAWDDALEAYQRIRLLRTEERGLMEVFDASGILLSGMTWLDWICLQGRHFPDRNRPLSRLAIIVSRIDALLHRWRV